MKNKVICFVVFLDLGLQAPFFEAGSPKTEPGRKSTPREGVGIVVIVVVVVVVVAVAVRVGASRGLAMTGVEGPQGASRGLEAPRAARGFKGRQGRSRESPHLRLRGDRPWPRAGPQRGAGNRPKIRGTKYVQRQLLDMEPVSN